MNENWRAILRSAGGPDSIDMFGEQGGSSVVVPHPMVTDTQGEEVRE